MRSKRERLAELMWPRLRGGIVECDHEIRFGGGLEAALDGGPALEIIRQRDGAEVATQRRADFGRRRQHRRHAGLDPDIERTPRRIPRLHRLEDRRGHGEHAGIAARHHGDAATGRRERQRVTRAVELDPVVGSVAALIGAQRRHAIEIRAVAHQIRRRGEGRQRRGSHQLGLAGASADDNERAGHNRLPSPGISTIAK